MASEVLAGRLLVATPVLGDPNFRRTVVLVVEHESEQGTLGVVLNRPTKVPVGQVLEPWTELATGPSVVFNGGPVAPNSALALAHVPGTGEPMGWQPLDGAPAVARRRPGRPGRSAGPARRRDRLLRVYAGYAGWSAASSRRRSTRAPGTWCPPSRPTRSAPSRAAVAGRAAPPGRRTRLRRDLSDDPA